MDRRRSFVLNNKPGGVETEPTWALVAATFVLFCTGTLIAVGVAWFVLTREPVTLGMVAAGVFFLVVDVASHLYIASESVGELRRRWRG